ncbi:hypothetical protein JW992_02355 [candidate division KSB1 bacterium]|nr:hypothetical protein [candidate division KSB1 bacterium]
MADRWDAYGGQTVIFFLLTLLGLIFLSLIVPAWIWLLAVPFLSACLARMGWKKGAFIGAAAAGLFWFGAAAIAYIAGARIVADRVAGVFGIGPGLVLVPLTGFLAALIGGISGAAGGLVQPPKQ